MLSAVGYAFTGSTPAMLAYLHGEHIYLDRTTATLDGVRANAKYDVPFALQNLTRQPIRIVGLKATCSCVVSKDYPRTIPPMARVVVPVEYRPKAQGGSFHEVVTLFTNAPTRPVIQLAVVGTVTPSALAAGEPVEDQLQPIPTHSDFKDEPHE